MSIQELKQFDADRMSIEQLIGLSAYGKAVQAEFDANEVEQPEWLKQSMRSLKRAIGTRNADELERRLADLKSRREALKTPTERKNVIDREIKKLEALVGAE